MDVLTSFEGTWRLCRRIEDRLGNAELVFEGSAQLCRAGDGLSYAETGRWTRSDWGGLRASRRHLWRAEGDRIAVFYPDGRPFHGFAVVPGGTSESGHDCAPDRYDVTYRFDLPDRWETVWRARGPAKDYTARTRYDRAGAVG